MKRLLAITALLVAACLLFAASEGANSPSANDSGWTTSDNAHSQSDTYAVGDSGQTVQYTTFGFSSVEGTVNGVTVETDAYRTGTRNNTLDINLLNVGTCSPQEGDILADSDTDTYQEFGGVADTWECTALTAANVVSSSFGVSVTGDRAGGPAPNDDTYHLDHVRVTVEYTAAAGAARRRIIVTED